MLTAKVTSLERDRRRVLEKRLTFNRQPFIVNMCGWSSASPIHDMVTKAFARSLLGDSKLPQTVRDIPGMSGQVYRSFINNLVEGHPEARYLEVGSWAGSTAVSALYGNSAKCVCIENWSQFGNAKDTFFANVEKVQSEAIDFRFIESDFRKVDYATLGSFNIYMFDGPHTERDQYDGIVMAQPALEKSHVLIVDDWNWSEVRDGTMRALIDTNCRVDAWIEVRTTFDNSHPTVAFNKESDWHNGNLIAVVEKM